MIRRARTPRGSLIAVTTLLGGCALLVASLGFTTAAFVQSATAEATLSGRVDVTQSGADHATVADALVVPAKAMRGVISRLDRDPVGPPTVSTASFPLSISTTAASAASDVWVTVSNPGVPADVWGVLRIGVYDDKGAALLPDGIPLAPDDIALLNDGRGASIGALDPRGTATRTITLRVWLDDDAGRSAFDAAVSMTIQLNGETTAPDTFTIDPVFS